MCPVQHHVGAAVGTEHKAGVLVLLIHIGSSALVLPHPLYHVPDLPRNEGGMGVLKDQALLSWMFDPSLVLVGSAAVLHVDGIAQIDLVFQHIRHGIPRPVIRSLCIQPHVRDAVLGVGVHGGHQDLLFLENAGNLAGATASGAHGEDPTDDGCRFLIHYQLLRVRVLSVAVRRPGPQPFAPFRFGLQHRTDLPAGVPNKPLVKQILERHEVIALAAVGIHIVIDGNVADAEHGESFLDVEPRVELISTEATEIFGHNDPDLAVFHV